jgi:inward rectifier potassium channel
MAKRYYVDPAAKGTPRKKAKETFYDLGFSSMASKGKKRFINKDGSFNVQRIRNNYQDLHLYQRVVAMSWWKFGLMTLLVYFFMNCFFAGLYLLNGIEHLTGAEADGLAPFWTAFFFSVQTITTVGYCSISPQGFMANLIAAMGAFAGLLGFALATGLLFARFSKPNARILFSDKAIVGGYRTGEAFMFRLANERKNMLTNLRIEVIAAWVVVDKAGKERRMYSPLELERDTLSMLPLSWTIVHPLTDDSPVSLCREMEDKADLEIMVILESYDDTFANIVRTHYSYKFDEIVWDAAFEPAFEFDENGDTILDLEKIPQYVTRKNIDPTKQAPPAQGA